MTVAGEQPGKLVCVDPFSRRENSSSVRMGEGLRVRDINMYGRQNGDCPRHKSLALSLEGSGTCRQYNSDLAVGQCN